MLLALVSTACGERITAPDTAAPTATAEEMQFSDPFAYCAAVGTIDAPDERYVGPAAPEAVIEDLRGKAEIGEDAPADWVASGTVWRCMDGKVWACFVGANLPCSEKADTSSTPQPEMEAFCQEDPNAETIPAAVTGRGTVYEWRCVDGTGEVVKQLFSLYTCRLIRQVENLGKLSFELPEDSHLRRIGDTRQGSRFNTTWPTIRPASPFQWSEWLCARLRLGEGLSRIDIGNDTSHLILIT